MAEIQEASAPVMNGHHHEEVPAVSPAPADAVPTPAKKLEIPTATLKEIKVTDYMRSCLDKVAVAENFVDYDIEIIHGSAIGDGFVGLIFKAIIREKNGSKSLTVVLKVPPEGARRIDFRSMVLFEREVLLYNEILPEFVKFQEEKKISKTLGFFNFPKCYFADYSAEKDESLLILEDLRESGYKMWDKFTPTNFEHTKFIVTALGKLHAVSFAMKTQKPELFEKFKGLGDLLGENLADDKFVGMFTASIDRAVGTIPETDVKKREKVLKLKQNLSQVMRDLTSGPGAEPYAIITHGDSWSNNFMYQYTRNRPTKIVLLDWQLSRYCSPVIDLAYFFFTCTSGELRAKHFDELLNIYHRSLKDLLDHLGGDTMEQFPFTAFMRQFKKFGKYGVLMSTFLIPMLSTRNEDLPDMDFMAENMKSEDPAVIEEMIASFGAKNDAYEGRMRAALTDAIRFGYI